MEIVLFGGLLAHIIQGLMLWSQNNSKRPVKYAVSAANENSKWYSRSMGLLGTLLLMFLIIHLYHFWTPSRFGGMGNVHALGEKMASSGEMVHDLYSEMNLVFQAPWVVFVYVLAMGSLAYHLLHGFQSAFQSLGLNHLKYTPIIKSTGIAFSIVIPAIFAAMPIWMHLMYHFSK
jgi:succinate dehydrogenase / fumarate reductase cytochrome b subunit